MVLIIQCKSLKCVNNDHLPIAFTGGINVELSGKSRTYRTSMFLLFQQEGV